MATSISQHYLIGIFILISFSFVSLLATKLNSTQICRYTSTEMLPESEMVHCDCCGRHSSMTKRMKLQHLPPVLCLQFKVFSFSFLHFFFFFIVFSCAKP